MSLKSLKIVTNEVSATEVGKYYLKIELSKLFPAEELRVGIDKTIDSLEDYDFWRLLEAMSFTFRLNWIFWAISNTKYTWSEEEWSPEEVTYVRMRPSIDKITFSADINGNPIKFRDYLKKYFDEHPNDDPEGLEQFRPTPSREINYEKLFLVHYGNKVELIDGGNRLMASLAKGNERLIAYTAHETNPAGKCRIGDSTFWLLGRTYIEASAEDKNAVLKTIELLVNLSVDGKQAAQNYWLNNIPDPELKKKCEELINSKS